MVDVEDCEFTALGWDCMEVLSCDGMDASCLSGPNFFCGLPLLSRLSFFVCFILAPLSQWVGEPFLLLDPFSHLFLLCDQVFHDLAEVSLPRVKILLSSSSINSCECSLSTVFSLKASKRLNKLMQCEGGMVTLVGSLGRVRHCLAVVTGDS